MSSGPYADRHNQSESLIVLTLNSIGVYPTDKNMANQMASLYTSGKILNVQI